MWPGHGSGHRADWLAAQAMGVDMRELIGWPPGHLKEGVGTLRLDKTDTRPVQGAIASVLGDSF